MFAKEALIKIFTGKESFSRHLMLFSICGTVGLFEAYMLLNGVNDPFIKFGYYLMSLVFVFLFIGYETIFLNERELPDINLKTIKLPFNKILFCIFLLSFPLIFLKMSDKFKNFVFIIEILMAVPITMIQGGFSYNFENKDALKLFKNFGFIIYIKLVFKRLLAIFGAYIAALFIIISLFFILGVVVLLMNKFDASMIPAIMLNQTVIGKVAVYISAIILVYLLSLATLVWDYELIKTLED